MLINKNCLCVLQYCMVDLANTYNMFVLFSTITIFIQIEIIPKKIHDAIFILILEKEGIKLKFHIPKK